VEELHSQLPTSPLDAASLDPRALDPVSLVGLCELAERAADLEAGLVTIVDAHGHEAGSMLLYRGGIVRAFVQERARPPVRRAARWAARGTRDSVDLRRSLRHHTAESLIALATHMHTLRWHGHASPFEYAGATVSFGEVLTTACSLVAPDLAQRAQRELARTPQGQRVLAYWMPPPDDVPLPIATSTDDVELAELLQVGRTAQQALATSTFTGRANEVLVAGSLAIWTDSHLMYVAVRSPRAAAA
jgi:hypothetical protein